MHAQSQDGSAIYYEVTGTADTAVVFVHGWMGNVRWWDAQVAALASDYRVVTLDLAGHGRSDRTRTAHSAEAYAADILAVVRAVAAPRVVLVGHSMSGAYVVAAATETPGLVQVILVDTLKNVTAPPPGNVQEMLALYRADYRAAVETILPRFLYAPSTPPAVIEQLAREFLAVTGDVAVTLLAPLYAFDAAAAARRVSVPVRGIASDLHPFDRDANRAVFADYAITTLAGCGHYPMLEVPDAFTQALRDALPRSAPAPHA